METRVSRSVRRGLPTNSPIVGVEAAEIQSLTLRSGCTADRNVTFKFCPLTSGAATSEDGALGGKSALDKVLKASQWGECFDEERHARELLSALSLLAPNLLHLACEDAGRSGAVNRATESISPLLSSHLA